VNTLDRANRRVHFRRALLKAITSLELLRIEADELEAMDQHVVYAAGLDQALHNTAESASSLERFKAIDGLIGRGGLFQVLGILS
jgi:hypothetical protein